MDVLRVLSSILLLGNVQFSPRRDLDDSFDVEVTGKDELNVVARLLGISTTLLWQGITTRTHTVRGQPVKSMSDANLVTVFSELCLFWGLRWVKYPCQICLKLSEQVHI